jgi:hypothetical protein
MRGYALNRNGKIVPLPRGERKREKRLPFFVDCFFSFLFIFLFGFFFFFNSSRFFFIQILSLSLTLSPPRDSSHRQALRRRDLVQRPLHARVVEQGAQHRSPPQKTQHRREETGEQQPEAVGFDGHARGCPAHNHQEDAAGEDGGALF